MWLLQTSLCTSASTTVVSCSPRHRNRVRLGRFGDVAIAIWDCRFYWTYHSCAYQFIFTKSLDSCPVNVFIGILWVSVVYSSSSGVIYVGFGGFNLFDGAALLHNGSDSVYLLVGFCNVTHMLCLFWYLLVYVCLVLFVVGVSFMYNTQIYHVE